MLRFLFDSNTTPEREDTKALYKRYLDSVASAQITDEERVHDLEMVARELENNGVTNNSVLGEELSRIFNVLADESDLYTTLQVATDAFVDDIALDVENRARMIRKTSLNEFAEPNRTYVIELLQTLGNRVLMRLPELCTSEDGAHQQFEVRLLDIIDEPLDLIRDLLELFSSLPLRDTALFYTLRQTLDVNLFYIETNIRKNARPEDLERDHKVDEIINLYLRNTCLEEFFSLRVPFVIPQKVRFEHMHLVAGSGHGKTQTLQYIISKDLEQVAKGKMGFAVIDSQGDLINEILSRKAIHDMQDRVLLIDPNDIAYPPALNMFDVGLSRADNADAVEREKIINGTIDLYSYIFSSLLGAELTQKQGVIFTYLARMMLVIPNANIYTLRDLVADHTGASFKQYFPLLDSSTRYFFEKQFFTSTFKGTRQQVQTRLWGVLSNRTFEKMFSSTESKVDLFDAMNSGKIVLINTAKDLLKQEGCSIFGRFFIALIAQAALSRSMLPVNERKPFFVTIDEAHDYFDDKVEDIANQARKFNVGLTLSHQNLDQASAKLRASIISSTSLKFVGGVSAKDAQVLAQNMNAKPDDILRAKKHKEHTQFACYVRNHTPTPILVDIPFGALESMPLVSIEDKENFIEKNRERVAHSNSDVLNKDQNSSSEFSKESDSTPQISEDDVPAHGKGGDQHKTLQQKISDAATNAGIEANIELHVGGGKHIDVVLYNGEKKIACEVSCSTSVANELANVEKCVDAGFSEIWMISENVQWQASFRRELEKHSFCQDISILDSNEAIELISQIKIVQDKSIVGGRVVETTYVVSTDQQKGHREIVLAKLATRKD